MAKDLPTSHDLSTRAARVQLQNEWTEIVAQLRNHPSVVMWICAIAGASPSRISSAGSCGERVVKIRPAS